MVVDTAFAFLHFAALLILAGALAAQAFLLRLTPSVETVRVLARTDVFYSVSAGLILIGGLGRVFLGRTRASICPPSLSGANWRCSR
jgi:uncharacterized membrane protein